MRHTSALGLLVAASAASLAGAPNITTLLLEGDNVPGVGNVTRIDNVAVNNNGTWFVEADTDNADTDLDTVLMLDGALYLQEGMGGLDAPAGALIDSFDSVTINNLGNGGFNFFLDPFPSGEDSGIYFKTQLSVQESDLATAPGFSANTPYIGFFDVKINDNDRLMSVASIDDPAIDSSVDRAIVIIDHTTGAQTLVAKEGDILPGQTEAVADFGTGPHQSAFNNNDDVMYFADLAGPTATDGAIYINNTLIAQEGSASPAAGRDYEFLTRGLDLNDNGDYAFKANLTGDAATDEAIIVNGSIVAQEGDTPAALGGFAITSLGSSSGPVDLDNNGNILWFADWDDPNTDIDTGLFLNDILIVQEGVTMIDGLLVDDIANGTDAFAISDDGRWVIFEATLAGGLNGAFLIEIPAPAPAAAMLTGLAAAAMRRRRD